MLIIVGVIKLLNFQSFILLILYLTVLNVVLFEVFNYAFNYYIL